MTPIKLQQTSIKVAIATIAISILILAINYFSSVSDLVYLEYLFIFVGIAINLILILRIINHTNKHRRRRRLLRIIGGINFLAILIALFAFRQVTGLLDTLKINLINTSAFELKDVKLMGCQKIRLEPLKPGANRRVTMKVNQNCSINIVYNVNGVTKNETLSAYVSESMGQELTFQIGSGK